MTLKKKLTFGLGFLFLIIIGMAIFCSYYVGKLSQDAENILKDNYKSLVFSRNMISALEETRTAINRIVFNSVDDKKASDYYLKLFEAGRTEFESNLKSEKQANITIMKANTWPCSTRLMISMQISVFRLSRGKAAVPCISANTSQPMKNSSIPLITLTKSIHRRWSGKVRWPSMIRPGLSISWLSLELFVDPGICLFLVLPGLHLPIRSHTYLKG